MMHYRYGDFRPTVMVLAAFLLCLTYAPQATAGKITGKIFNESDIYAMSVESLRLDMTQEEAAVILKQNRWEGKWRDYAGPEITYYFTRDGETMYLMWYRDKERQLRLWSIVNKKGFNRSGADNMPANRVLGQVWIDSIVAHFGPPSIDFINPDGINAYVYYLSDPHDQAAAKLEIYLSRNEETFELSDRKALARHVP